MVSFTATARRRKGANSAANAVALGNAPPAPNPVTKRKTASANTECTNDVATVARPKRATQPISAGRRPKRSPQ